VKLLRLTFLVVLAAAAATAGAQNLVVNGDFEGGWGPPQAPCEGLVGNTTYSCCVAAGWKAWSVPLGPMGGSPIPGHPTFTEMPGGNCTADPGNNYQRIAGGEKCPGGQCGGYNCRGGIVQAIPTQPGVEYDLDLIVKFLSTRGPYPFPRQSYWYIGIDTTGQTDDPLAPTVSWTPEYPVPQGGYATLLPWEGVWNRHHRRFAATGTQTSVWFMLLVPEDGRGYLDLDNISVTPATQPLITITGGPTYTRLGDRSYRIEWTTDVPSDSRVEYGKSAPASDEGLSYETFKYDGTLTTSHSVVLNGLDIDSRYHFRVVSAAPGYRTAYSFDDTFVTPGPAQPLFKNGGFEDVDAEGNHTLYPWVTFGNIGQGLVGPYPKTGPTGWFFDFRANEGSYFFGFGTNYGLVDGGAYQRLQAVPGGSYTVDFDYRTQNWDFDVMTPPIGRAAYDDIQVWVGIDPTGGVDWRSPDVVWGKRWTTGYDFISRPPVPGRWSPPALPLGTVSATAQGDRITVFIRYFNKWPWVWSIAAVDNLRLSGPPLPPAQVQTIGQARDLGQFAYVETVNPCVVTLVPLDESGFFYMQDLDGTAGIRVNASDPVTVGELVKVRGTVDVNAKGEMVIRDATVMLVSGTAEPKIRTVKNRDAGGKGYSGQTAGLSNQGLLMRVFGRVTYVNYFDGYFLLDDGSGVESGETEIDPNTGQPYRGIRVTKIGGAFPVTGGYYAARGVVTSDIVSGRKIRVLRSRDGLFPDDIVQLAP
jgi:hypothetical protein